MVRTPVTVGVLLALVGAACAVGAPDGSSGEALARVPSTSSKADGAEGAAYWDVYTEGATMTWVGTDAAGQHEDRLSFRDEGDSIWLEVDRDGRALTPIGLAMSGEVISSPDDGSLDEIGDLLDEAVRDSDALATDEGKADGADEAPNACREARELTVGQVLRLCAASVGAVWRLTTGRGNREGVGGFFSLLADIVTPYACTGGLAELVHAPGSLRTYCQDPAHLEITNATVTCPEGAATCSLALGVALDCALPEDALGSEWLSADVYAPNGERVGWTFPTPNGSGTWSGTATLWDLDPTQTYRVRVSGDLSIAAETSVSVSR